MAVTFVTHMWIRVPKERVQVLNFLYHNRLHTKEVQLSATINRNDDMR